MPPKRGTKRGRNSKVSIGDNSSTGDAPLAPPNRETWRGWIELESEPAFFTTMLEEMGVEDVVVEEVVSLDDEMLAHLPRPVYSLIFLFRYHEGDNSTENQAEECPKSVWFANQTPEFACATFALLNSVFNIPDVELGRKLRNFKQLTQDMDPVDRGDAIDDFDFVRRIHNSFARESDLLQAEMHMKDKAARFRKRQATLKAAETRKAKAAARGESNGVAKGKSSTKNGDMRAGSNASGRRSASVKSTAGSGKDSDTKKQSTRNKQDQDDDYDLPAKDAKRGQANPPRRSSRAPKPREDLKASTTNDEEPNDGFHFITYVPVDGRVWRMDGLQNFPEDIGSYEGIGLDNWMEIALPALQERMDLFAGAELEFNLMAVVKDPGADCFKQLVSNVKTHQAIKNRFDELRPDPDTLKTYALDPEAITGPNADFGIDEDRLARADLLPGFLEQFEDKNTKSMDLLGMRTQLVRTQEPLREAMRSHYEEAEATKDKVKHRRHDYGIFVRSWLQALAENQLLADLMAD